MKILGGKSSKKITPVTVEEFDAFLAVWVQMGLQPRSSIPMYWGGMTIETKRTSAIPMPATDASTPTIRTTTTTTTTTSDEISDEITTVTTITIVTKKKLTVAASGIQPSGVQPSVVQPSIVQPSIVQPSVGSSIPSLSATDKKEKLRNEPDPFISGTMTRDRWQQIYRQLFHLPVELLEEVQKSLNENFKKNYVPFQNNSIDELSVSYKGLSERR